MKRSDAFDKAFEIVSKRAKYYPDGILGVIPVYAVSYDGQHFESRNTNDLVKAVMVYILKKEKE
jgi:hypothetical protein